MVSGVHFTLVYNIFIEEELELEEELEKNKLMIQVAKIALCYYRHLNRIPLGEECKSA